MVYVPTPENRPNCNVITYSGVFGSLASPIEQWSFSLKTGPLVFVDQADRVAYTGRMRTALIGSLLWSGLPNTVHLTRTRVAQTAGSLVLKGSNGEYLQADNVTSATGGTTGGSVFPLQTAMVISLVTDRSGATGKGRFFLPWPALALQTDYRIDAAAAQLKADHAALFVQAINNDTIYAGNQDGDVVVASEKGYLSTVKSVRVGRAPDTQRSRRSDVLEGYASKVLV